MSGLLIFVSPEPSILSGKQKVFNKCLLDCESLGGRAEGLRHLLYKACLGRSYSCSALYKKTFTYILLVCLFK